MCLNRIAHQAHVRFRHSAKDRADIAPTDIDGVPVMLAQPQTFMNESGIAAARLAQRLNLSPDHCLVVYDDVDLPFGSVRIRSEGSAGGQKGMRSIIDHLKTSEIPRIRVGIGRSGGRTTDHVLSEFGADERIALTALCDHVAQIVGVIVADGVVAAMNRFNGQDPVQPVSESAPGSDSKAQVV
jgi:PTH1 family peptidyl-tRNA hydrolase